jgi:hypothetical protein
MASGRSRLRTVTKEPPSVKDVLAVEKKMLYALGSLQQVIFLGTASEVANFLSIDVKTIPENADYILGFGFLSCREGKDHTAIEMGPVVPLSQSELEKILEVAEERLAENKGAVIDTERIYFKFNYQEPEKNSFFFNVFDKARTKKDEFGVGGGYEFTDDLLKDFAALLRNYCQ